MTTLLLIGFFMSLFLIILMIGKKNKVLADKMLICIFAVYALTIGGPYIEIYNRNNNFPYPHFINNAWLFLLLHGPFLWFYVKSLTIKHFKIKYFHLLHFLPFVIFLILHIHNYLFLNADEKILLTKDELFTTTVLFKIRGIFIGITSIGYNIWAFRLLRRHRINIENQFSNIENIDLSWLKTLVIASLMVFSVNVSLFNINNYLQFAGFYELAKIAYSFSAVYVFYIGYFGIKQGRIFVDYPAIEVELPFDPLKQDEYKTIKQKDYSHIISKLSRLMEHELPYLDPDLNLAKLSKLINVKPEILSEVLNSSLNQNFFDFINKYRIEDFKIKILDKENRHFSVMGIAYDCGFNSKAAFYRAFNKFEGISPTAYISKVSLKK
jgi:AraC-like DNA-binding protein